MATTIIHNFPSDGPHVARGVTTSFDDGDTIDTGLGKADGFQGISNTADTVIGFTSQSAGVVTASGKTAGSGASSVTVYWEAWILPKNA